MSPLTPSQAVLGGEDNSVAPSRAKHTPGPWSAIHGKSGGTQDCFYIHSEADRLASRITTVFVQGGVLSRAEADAQLIAAAPDLLEALKALYHRTIIGTTAERHAALNYAWVIIAKAEGRERDGSSPKDPTSRTEGASK